MIERMLVAAKAWAGGAVAAVLSTAAVVLAEQLSGLAATLGGILVAGLGTGAAVYQVRNRPQ